MRKTHHALPWFSSMHDKRVIMDSHHTYGNYNLSCAARFANWREALYIADADGANKDDFDDLWTNLEGRSVHILTSILPP
jgi:hypothetical protein